MAPLQKLLQDSIVTAVCEDEEFEYVKQIPISSKFQDIFVGEKKPAFIFDGRFLWPGAQLLNKTISNQELLLKCKAETVEELLDRLRNGADIWESCRFTATSKQHMKVPVYDSQNQLLRQLQIPLRGFCSVDGFEDVVLSEAGSPPQEHIWRISGLQKLQWSAVLKNADRIQVQAMKKNNDDDAKSNNNEMEIFVKTEGVKIYTIVTQPSALVEEVMCSIEKSEGLAIDQQRLIFAGQQLEMGRSLADYKIRDGSTLHLVLRLRGGMYHYTSGKDGGFNPLLSDKQLGFTPINAPIKGQNAVNLLRLMGAYDQLYG